jgi:hypothetical protein
MTTMHGTMDEAAARSATVRGWLRLEGAAVFIAGLAAYGWLGGPWPLVIPLLLLPDVSAIGYLRDPRVGAFTYNLVHNWAFGLGLLAAGLAPGSVPIEILGTIAIAHTGMDRAVGYGLKLPTSFQDTHLGRMGKNK